MFFYIVRRLISVVVMLIVISATTFLIFFASPVDPASLTCGKSCTPAVIEGDREKMGYDDPVPVQYLKFLQGLFVGRDYPTTRRSRPGPRNWSRTVTPRRSATQRSRPSA